MAQKFSREDFLAVANASPAAVAVHDKEAWLSIFGEYNVVEDPVGSTPHISGPFDHKTGKRGNAPLKRFYDNFIAPNKISFNIDNDIVADFSVVRDLTLDLVMSTGLKTNVPMHLIYQMIDEKGELKVCRLGAYWELPAMIRQILGKGFAGFSTMTAMSFRMMKYMGISGGIGFSKGFRGIYQKGKNSVSSFMDAVNSKNGDKLQKLFTPEAAGIEFPAGSAACSPESFLNQVDIKLSVSKLMSAGYNTSCTFEADVDGKKVKGVGFFEFSSKTKKIDRTRLFFES